MTPEDLLGAATVAEEVTDTGETVSSVDLQTVSQQLDRITVWQMGQFGTQWVLIGCIIGLAVALVIGRMWR